MEHNLEILQDDEVISSINPEIIEEIRLPKTAKASELISEIFMSDWSEEFTEMVLNKFDCEVLRYSQNNWQKGKLKFCLCFVPDENSENQKTEEERSSLDTIRGLTS